MFYFDFNRLLHVTIIIVVDFTFFKIIYNNLSALQDLQFLIIFY